MNMHIGDVMAASPLSMADIQAICHCLNIPLAPNLTGILNAANLSPTDVIARLEQSTDVHALIAAAVMKGTVTVLPPDAQFTPKPHPRSPVKKPMSEDEAKRATPVTAPVVRSDGTRILTYVAPNTKRPGSASRDRYALYEIGLSEAALIKKGIYPADIRWDSARDFLRWEPAK